MNRHISTHTKNINCYFLSLPTILALQGQHSLCLSYVLSVFAFCLSVSTNASLLLYYGKRLKVVYD